MKKSIFLAVAAVAMTACSNDVDLGMKDANKQTADNAIGFEILNKNMSRADPEKLENAGHYNFGVWAYKSTDATHDIMANYLVGYFGSGVGYQQFNDRTTDDGKTSSDLSNSEWAYEGLGYGQYVADASHTFTPGYYNPTDNPDYMSNIKFQYVRYWDYSASETNFFAYAPYIKGSNTVTYVHADKKMTFPNGSIKDGYDDRDKYEYMYAAKQIVRTNYGKAVQLGFKRINAKVNIGFYEDIPGYKVTLNNLVNDYTPISAAPAKQNGENHEYSNGLYKSAGATITFSGSNLETGALTHTWGSDVYTSGQYLSFKLPETSGFIAEAKSDITGSKKSTSYSQTTYYAIPKETTNECGLTFHVSFTLTSTTGETIAVKDARVFVPASKCKWEANTAYTYIFRITKDATGSTDQSTIPVPGDPEINDKALHPIVFDDVTVEGWTDAADSEHDIN